MNVHDRPGADDVRIVLARFPGMTEADLAEWKALYENVRSSDEDRLSGRVQWAPLDDADWSVRLWMAEELVACAWATQRRALVDGRELVLGGVRGVMTDPGHRRAGLGRAVMARLDELFVDLGTPAALLFSTVMAVPFYASLGWKVVTVPVFCEQPEGRIEYASRIPPEAPVMIRLWDETPMPTRTIDVHGLPW